MAENFHVARRQVAVNNVLGLHLRVANKFVKLANAFQSDVKVYCKGIISDGRSILSLLSLAAECGTTLALEAQGCDAEDVVAALANLISAQSHETEDQQNEESGSSPEPPAGIQASPQVPGPTDGGASWKSSPRWDSSRRMPSLESGVEGRSAIRGRWSIQRSRQGS